MPKTEFDYYYGAESEQFSFVRVPRVLFTDKEHFGNLSNEAKLLYGLLLERMSLSRKNNWIDKHNRVYIIFPVEEIGEILDVDHEKALNLLKELDDQSGSGLVKKKRRGLGLPSILYVKNFIIHCQQSSDSTPTSRSTENGSQEVGKLDFKKSENQTSANPKNKLLEVRNSDTNYIDKNNIEMSYIEMSYIEDQSVNRSRAGFQNFSPVAVENDRGDKGCNHNVPSKKSFHLQFEYQARNNYSYPHQKEDTICNFRLTQRFLCPCLTPRNYYFLGEMSAIRLYIYMYMMIIFFL